MSDNKRKVRLIFTVGLSLLENARKLMKEKVLLEETNKNSIATGLDEADRATLTTLYNQSILSSLLRKEPSKISAETHSYKQLHDKVIVNREKDHLDVVLLGTEGNDEEPGSIECAQRLASYLKDRFSLNNIQTVEIKGGVKGDKAFKEALGCIVSKLREYLDKGEVDETYVVITGGYKGFIPWLTIATALYDNTYLVYVHEHSKEVLVWPGLYLHWDLRRLDELRSIIRRTNLDKKEWKLLPPPAQYLYDGSGTRYQRNELGQMVYEFFEQSRLARYGYGRLLLGKLKAKNGGQDLAKIIEARLPYWEHLWIGDQIPETVEHSRLHSLRLMEYAYWLLRYCPELDEKLGAEQLFYLICALWLHDIGHGALDYNGQPIGKMPSLVREYHNLTSAKIIRNEKGFQALPPEALLPNEHKEKVALMAEYNRRKQPLTPEHKGALEQEANQANVSPLNSEPLSKRDSSLLLVTALLGILDGLDVQIDRAVTADYRKMREQRTRYEIETYLKWLDQQPEPKNIPDVLTLSQLKCFFERYKGNSDDVNLQQEIENAIKKSEEVFQEAYNKGEKDVAKLEWASLANRILFKMNQRPHVAKHGAVDLVYLSRGEDNALRINLLPTEDANEGDLKKIEGEIRQEVVRALYVQDLQKTIHQIQLWRLKNNTMEQSWSEPNPVPGGGK
ncbi:MAG: HD domain-containing protein [Candidatus Methanomethylicaceae archaeon]